MKKQIIIKTISISKAGQRVHDQIILPHNAIRITGVHHSMIMQSDDEDIIEDTTKSGLFFRNVLHVGDLRLQLNTPENWFFADVVTIQDRNLFWGDVSILPGFFPNPATHSMENFRFLSVDCNVKSGIVQVYYRDRWGLVFEEHIQYQVRIYLEVEIETEKLCS